jgi:hypothetical protein
MSYSTLMNSGKNRPATATEVQDLIEFQYFDGCPNAQETLDNLRSVREELGIPESSVEMVEVPDPAQAEERRFQGSPTILIDGRDITTGEVPSGFNYTCRMYWFEGEPTGVIPREFIRARLMEWGATLDH